jgi:hypothetical protein
MSGVDEGEAEVLEGASKKIRRREARERPTKLDRSHKCTRSA